MRNSDNLLAILCFSALLTSAVNAQDTTYPFSENGIAPVQSAPATPAPELNGLSSTKTLTSCWMKYKLSGFSLIFKQYDGIGEIFCRNGEKAQVSLSSKSVGFTIGKSEIEGEGQFSDVKSINEIYGDFMSMESHAGFINSVDAQLLTRGEISLALRGKGRGIDIGATIGDLSIKRR